MLGDLKELWRFAMARKKIWMVPIVLFLAALGLLIVATQGSVVAPFIYALF